MRVRPYWFALALGMTLIPTAARAHGHTADVFGGLCFASGSTLSGARETYALVLKRQDPNAVRYWSLILGDIGLHFGEHDGVDVAQIAGTVGIRGTYARSTMSEHLPFAQVLIGALHSQDGVRNPTDFAFGLGLGYEWAPAQKAVAFRVQFDYLRGLGENFPGLSIGIVHRFKKEP